MKNKPKSHPDKLLIDHKLGIVKSIKSVDLCDLLLLAILFHDIGKLGTNFQKKINGLKYTGYSNHAHISAYYIINGFLNNKKTIIKHFKSINEKNYNSIILILVNVVVSHHGYLRDVKNIFTSEDEWNAMVEYLKKDMFTKKVNEFFQEEIDDILGCKLRFTDDYHNSEFYKDYGRLKDNGDWNDNALQYYFDVLMVFAELVNGDRKDASRNQLNYRKLKNVIYGYVLENNLEWLLGSFNSDGELNHARTEIRLTAVKSLRRELRKQKKNSNRVFTLTAPTGCGKTLTLLQLALEIMKSSSYKFDVLYSLPQLSIIDQTSRIINNDLRIETLNYTSSSDTSKKLQGMMEGKTTDSKEMFEYAFSENSFDHPFIITTFNKLFETLFSNSTSSVLRLKNLKNRIFIIDEYQAASPTQYYTLIHILNEFCKKYDSYAIISTATMPSFNINLDTPNNYFVKKLFKEKFYPKELLPKKFFSYRVFNRYRMNFIGVVNENTLYDKINIEDRSILLIMNTIASSEAMYTRFIVNSNNFEKIYLINANESPQTRLDLIKRIKEDLANNIKILVVTTQAIEAGVDISFPRSYSDTAPPPNLIQRAGRVNRNGEFDICDFNVFLFQRDDGRFDCDMVYQSNITRTFKNDIRNQIPSMTEIEFHKKCEKYFVGLTLRPDTEEGEVNDELNIVYSILEGSFSELGRYRFIQGDPDAATIYVGKNDDDWEEYTDALDAMKTAKTYQERDYANIRFRKIRGVILKNSINIKPRVFEQLIMEQAILDDFVVFGVYRLIHEDRYSSEFGLFENIM